MKRTWLRCCALLLLAAMLPAAVAFAAPADAAVADTVPPLALTADEQALVAEGGTLRVGYVQDRIPISFTGADGSLAGVSRYIFDSIAARCGLTFEYVPLPAGAVTYEYLLDQKLDLVTSVEYNEENLGARGILTSEPYLSSRKVVVARDDLEFSFNAPHTVAISSGSQTIAKVLTSQYPHFSLVNYSSITDCFDAVRSGEADLMIQNQYVVEYWISKPAYEVLKVIPVMGMDDQLCFSAVVTFDEREGPSAERGQVLISLLNKAIDAMSEDEVSTYTIQALMENQYTFTLSDILYRYRFPAVALLAALCIILVLAALLLHLRMRSLADRADAKAKGQFLSTMSHEIRTPINGLIGLNYLMAQNLDDPQRLTEQLHRSTATAQYLLSLVNDILDMSKLDSHKLELVPGPVDLQLLVDTVQTLTASDIAAKGLHFDIDAQLPWPHITGDEARIQQVLLNLLDNARKFTPKGGQITLQVRQTRAAADAKVVTSFRVQDNGQGMSEAFQKQVFTAFAQELKTVSKGDQGTGLGLSISRALARLMKGDLTFTSQEGKGSDFLFTFPAEAAAPPQAQAVPAAPAAPAAGRHILVAEDNQLNGEIIVDLLTDAGFEMTLAKDGRAALELFRASPVGTYPVILMDLLMPELNGYEATAAIRALDRPDAATARIIACTANAFDEDRERALRSGMDDFLPKPLDITVLLQKLASLGAQAGGGA